jgi:hypothetical protein
MPEKTPVYTDVTFIEEAKYDNLAGRPVPVVQVDMTPVSPPTTPERVVPDRYLEFANSTAQYAAYCDGCAATVGDDAETDDPSIYRYVPVEEEQHFILTNQETAANWAREHAANCAANY